MKPLLAAALALLTASAAFAQKQEQPPKKDEPAKAVAFADKNLEAAVRAALQEPKAELKEDNLRNVFVLEVPGQKIADLGGLEKCKNLSLLKLTNNQVKDLKPLKDLTNLQSLDLAGNQVEDVAPLAGLTKLQYLELSGNQVAKLDALKDLTTLSALDLSGNQVSDLGPLANLAKLSSLRLGKNQIKDLAPLAKVTRLSVLELTDNQVADLAPLTKQTDLRMLLLEKNKVSDLAPLVAWAEADAKGQKRFAPYLELYLKDNPLSEAAKKEQLPALKAAGVRVKSGPASAANTDVFPLKDGDTWVLGGDSITAQHLHSNYFEAFCFARYPKMTFRFRNSGVGGDTIPKLIARFDWDVAAWKPTVVSVELGMNDKGGFTPAQYITNMGQLHDRIKGVGARAVYFTASPVNDGGTSANLKGNARLDEYAKALKAFAAEKKAPYADQFHAVLDVWGKNKPLEPLANALPGIKALAQDKDLAGAEHLRAFLAAVREKYPFEPVSMMGDPVHPGPTGQLMMAAALLKELNADGFVSTVTVDGKEGKLVEAKGCKVEGVKAEGGKLAFDRLDESLPFPIPAAARPVLPLYPTILELSQYTLKVTGLPGERYALSVNNTPVATLTAQELAKGVNLTAFDQGAIAAQGVAVLNAVAAKETLVGQWRNQSKAAAGGDADAKAKVAALTKQVEDADAKVREAAKPKTLHFELVPAK